MKGDRIVLRDGSQVRIRPIEPDDAPLLAEGFDQLSDQSRWLRFLTYKSKLSPEELRYFTEVDHHDHEAVAALDGSGERGLGVARFIRLTDRPDTAEVAVTVLDDWQNRGLGTALLIALTDRAREEGVRRFSAVVAVDNEAVLALLDDLDADVDVRVIHHEAGTVEYEFTLPPAGLGTALHALLRAFARRHLQRPGVHGSPSHDARPGLRGAPDQAEDPKVS